MHNLFREINGRLLVQECKQRYWWKTWDKISQKMTRTWERPRILSETQWRSNGRFSRFKEPGPPTVRGPDPSWDKQWAQVIVARRKCSAIGSLNKYSREIEICERGSLAFSRLKNVSTLLSSSISFPVSWIWSKYYHCFNLYIPVSVASDKRSFSNWTKIG